MFRMDNDYITKLRRTFGENFFEQRKKKKGWSLDQAVASMGISRAQIQKYEKGVNFPEVARLIVIADIFGVSLDDLIGRKISHKEERIADPVPEPDTGSPARKRRAS